MTIQMDKDLRYIFDVLPSFGTRYSNLVMAYCCLFGVTPFQLKAKKLRLIMEEMKRLFDAQAFSYQKKLYPISHDGIAEALDIMVKRNWSKHLSNHNYLKLVMIDISEREGKASSKTAEKDLRKKEDNLKSGSGRSEDDTLSKGLSQEQIDNNLQRVSSIIMTLTEGKQSEAQSASGIIPGAERRGIKSIGGDK